MSKTNYLQAVISVTHGREAGANAGYRLFASGFTNSRTDLMNI